MTTEREFYYSFMPDNPTLENLQGAYLDAQLHFSYSSGVSDIRHHWGESKKLSREELEQAVRQFDKDHKQHTVYCGCYYDTLSCLPGMDKVIYDELDDHDIQCRSDGVVHVVARLKDGRVLEGKVGLWRHGLKEVGSA